MLGALEYILVPLVGGVVWHETRVFGKRREDRDWIEAAPVVAGLVVAVGYVLGGELLMPVEQAGALASMSVWDVRLWTAKRAVLFGTMTMLVLLALEAALVDDGYIDHEWRLLGAESESTQEGP